MTHIVYLIALNRYHIQQIKVVGHYIIVPQPIHHHTGC